MRVVDFGQGRSFVDLWMPPVEVTLNRLSDMHHLQSIGFHFESEDAFQNLEILRGIL